MLRGLMKAGGILLGLAVVLVGLSYNVLRAQGLESAPTMADRAVASETRPVDARVTIVKVSGPIDLVLKQGPAAAMTVRAERRVLSRIRTVQAGRTPAQLRDKARRLRETRDRRTRQARHDDAQSRPVGFPAGQVRQAGVRHSATTHSE